MTLVVLDAVERLIIWLLPSAFYMISILDGFNGADINCELLDSIIEEEGINKSKQGQWTNVAKRYFNVKRNPAQKQIFALFYACHKLRTRSDNRCLDGRERSKEGVHMNEMVVETEDDNGDKSKCGSLPSCGKGKLIIDSQVINSCQCVSASTKCSHYHCPVCNNKQLKCHLTKPLHYLFAKVATICKQKRLKKVS